MRSGFQFLVSKYDAQGSCATYVTANFKRVYLKMACSHMLLSCNIHMYYLRPATLAFVRRFRREAALAGAAVRVMGVPVRVNACAAAAKSKAEKAQRIMVPRPLFFPVHSHMPHSFWSKSTGFQQFSRAEKCARLVLYCKSGEKSCEHLCKSSRSPKFCRVVAGHTLSSAFSLFEKARLTVAMAMGCENTKRIAVGSSRRGRH
jgi:hypothetical protein